MAGPPAHSPGWRYEEQEKACREFDELSRDAYQTREEARLALQKLPFRGVPLKLHNDPKGSKEQEKRGTDTNMYFVGFLVNLDQFRRATDIADYFFSLLPDAHLVEIYTVQASIFDAAAWEKFLNWLASRSPKTGVRMLLADPTLIFPLSIRIQT